MATKFVKLFETEKGQILVKLDRNIDGIPEVRIFVQPDGLGVCSVAASYTDDDEGWDLAESWFAAIDEELAIKHSKMLFNFGDEEIESRKNENLGN